MIVWINLFQAVEQHELDVGTLDFTADVVASPPRRHHLATLPQAALAKVLSFLNEADRGSVEAALPRAGGDDNRTRTDAHAGVAAEPRVLTVVVPRPGGPEPFFSVKVEDVRGRSSVCDLRFAPLDGVLLWPVINAVMRLARVAQGRKARRRGTGAAGPTPSPVKPSFRVRSGSGQVTRLMVLAGLPHEAGHAIMVEVEGAMFGVDG
jgi:hypothetical protein